MKKILFFVCICFLLALPAFGFAHQPRIIYNQIGEIEIQSPELSQAFYDELKGESRNYYIDSDKEFSLYINLLVPLAENREGRYSAKVFLEDKEIAFINGQDFEWQEYWEEFGRDYYLRGPEFEQKVSAGKYKIEVFGDPGKYVLAVGKLEQFDARALLNTYWQLPVLKLQFFKSSPLQFFLTPFGIGGIAGFGGILILLALIYYFIGAIRQAINHRQAKTMLLTSGGMQMKDEIIKLLQKPAYNVSVGFITTAAKPQQNLDYLWKDWNIMKEELGFNVEEVDIEGKTEAEVMKLLQHKDIIFVEGGNTFYLLKAMRSCNFEKIIRKLFKKGTVYVGASAGSMVAGRTIKTAEWKGNKNIVNLKNLKGMNFVPFDVFVHYHPEDADLIKQKIKNPKKRKKNLRILTDDQAILVQGREVMLIGKGEQIII